MAQTNQQYFPQITSPLVNLSNGTIQQSWYQLLVALWNRTGAAGGSSPLPISPVTVISSPIIITANNPGNIWISPGTYCSISIKRGPITLHYGKITRGIFPMSVGDVATITYNTLTPTVYFI